MTIADGDGCWVVCMMASTRTDSWCARARTAGAVVEAMAAVVEAVAAAAEAMAAVGAMAAVETMAVVEAMAATRGVRCAACWAEMDEWGCEGGQCVASPAWGECRGGGGPRRARGGGRAGC